MTLETQVADLTTATSDLITAVNVRKAVLDSKVDASTAQAVISTTKAGEAAASAVVATTKASESAGSAASALAIYGSTALQQAAVTAAQAAASNAAGYAASAGSAIQQDISGVTAAALHRSPNAVTAMYIYNTTKDSDGGAWTEKCQHTSWYNEPLNGKWLGACATESAARAVSGATTGDYFQLTTDGKFYKLNAGSGTTEVFRGNKAKFPKLAAIVAEAASITIYDLTEPGRPMWMRFAVGSSYVLNSTPTISSVSALNGSVFVASSAASAGSPQINFPLDYAILWRQSAHISYKGWNLARRNSTFFTEVYPLNLVSSAANAVAMCILPDAPIDPATGLQVPTIAVATAGGVSVIKQDGSVGNWLTASGSINWIAIDKKGYLIASGGVGVGHGSWMRTTLPVGTDNTSTLVFNGSAYPARLGSSAGVGNTAMSVSNAEKIVATSSGIFKFKDTASSAVKALVTYITSAYNTGYQVGDIRRTYLADSVVESVTGTELVANGTFADTTGWSTDAGGTIAAVGGELQLTTVAGTPGNAYCTIATVPGKSYRISANAHVGTTNAVTLKVGKTAYANDLVNVYTGSATAVPLSGTFVATGTTTYVAVINYAVSGGTGYVDNVSVKECLIDRSYKGLWATVFGTLTKSLSSPSASNQLVAYSGFSAANYLQEPYSADLDFGTGEWNVSAWVNIPARMNQFIKTEALDDANWIKYEATVDTTKYTAPDGTLTAQKLLATTVNNNHYIRQPVTVGGNGQLVFYAAPGGYSYCSMASNANGYVHFDLTNGNVSTLGPGWASATCVAQANGFYKITVTASAPQTWVNAIIYIGNAWNPSGATGPWAGVGDPTKGILLWHPDVRDSAFAAVTPAYQRVNTAADYGDTGVIADRNYSSGAGITLSEFAGFITATAYDGTTTRTVTTSAAYNTGTMLKARAVYRLDGSLSIMVNGVTVATTYGNPLLTLNNSNAVLTIGNSYALDAPFPGSIALLKLSATAPTPDQSLWMYEQEKHLFRDGANCLLPDSGNVVDLTYDEATDKWIAVSAANESAWTGLVRTGVTAVPAGSNIKAAASSGIKLNARSTTSPGVDVTIPAWNLREELVKRAEAAAKAMRPFTIFDYSGGFTATTVIGNSAITSVASLTYPSQGSLRGATVTGTGIPAGTTIVDIVGTTINLSKVATAAGTAVQIALSDFILPVGYETRAVQSAGALKQEGATKDWTRSFDGFREKVTFGTAPGYSAFVEIQAVRSNA